MISFLLYALPVSKWTELHGGVLFKTGVKVTLIQLQCSFYGMLYNTIKTESFDPVFIWLGQCLRALFTLIS